MLPMKNLTLLAAFLAISLTANAQEWKSDLNDAIKEASVSGKNVLLFFSVAQDCERCTSLDKTVLQSTAFKDFARDNYILVKQDFNQNNPKKIEENLLIVEKYNKDGFFPLVVILNQNAKVLGQIGAYNNESPQQYVARLQTIKRS